MGIRARLAMCVAAAMVVFAPMAGAAPRQAPPVVAGTFDPPTGVPGQAYTFFVNCPYPPRVSKREQFSDGIQPIQMQDLGAGAWSYETVAGEADDYYRLEWCDGVSGNAVFDVENPILNFVPILGVEPLGVYGTDCDRVDGNPKATITVTGRDPIVVPAAHELRGDWQVDLPDDAADLGFRVEATCGAISYEPLVWAASAPPTSTTTTLIPLPGPGPATPPAPAAEPARATASFTG